MIRCRCKEGTFVPGSVPVAIEAAGHRFRSNVAGLICDRCPESLIEGEALERFELGVAAELARAAPTSDAFRFLRRVLGCTLGELAELLRRDAEAIARWESGEVPIDRAAWIALRFVVLARRSASDTEIEAALREAATPIALPAEIEVQG